MASILCTLVTHGYTYVACLCMCIIVSCKLAPWPLDCLPLAGTLSYWTGLFGLALPLALTLPWLLDDWVRLPNTVLRALCPFVHRLDLPLGWHICYAGGLLCNMHLYVVACLDPWLYYGVGPTFTQWHAEPTFILWCTRLLRCDDPCRACQN